MVAKVKACPLCGNKAEVRTSEIAEQIYCPHCGARNIWHPDAREHWNTRKRRGTDLKPCPICGGAERVCEAYDSKYYVQCRKCGFTTGDTPNSQAAKTAWNRRTKHE